MGVKARAFTEVLDILSNTEQPLDAGTVYGLSALDNRQVTELAKLWPGYPVERRRKLIQHLNEVSESNFEMDFTALNHLALKDTDSEVREHAINGLWEDESLTLMHKLVHIVRHDLSPDVRSAALTALGRFILLGEYESISKGNARLAQNTVLEILHSNEENLLRRRALEAIANGSNPAIRDTIEEFYVHPDLDMQLSAVFAMGRTCDSAWESQVIEQIASRYPEMQYEAARAAGHMELQEAVPHLVNLIDRAEDTEILEIAIWALGEIGGEEARRVLNDIITNAEGSDEEELLDAARDALDAASLPGDFLLFDIDME